MTSVISQERELKDLLAQVRARVEVCRTLDASLQAMCDALAGSCGFRSCSLWQAVDDDGKMQQLHVLALAGEGQPALLRKATQSELHCLAQQPGTSVRDESDMLVAMKECGDVNLLRLGPCVALADDDMDMLARELCAILQHTVRMHILAGHIDRMLSSVLRMS